MKPGGSVHRTRIKICGITSVRLAQVAVESGADAVGLVFARQSPRYVLPHAALQISRSLPPFVVPVAVFHNATDPDALGWQGDWVQLHGQADEHQIARIAQSKRVIRGFAFDPGQTLRWSGCAPVSAMLIDGSEGGGGESFEHDQLGSMMSQLTKPVILAGGLTPENVGEAIRAVRPYAVDVSSGVETERGVKEPGLIRDFCLAVQEADGNLTVAPSR
jgi:phosphoribosylanthranilate isomerase